MSKFKDYLNEAVTEESKAKNEKIIADNLKDIYKADRYEFVIKDGKKVVYFYRKDKMIRMYEFKKRNYRNGQI